MISESRARQFATLHYPEAPERLAEHLKVIVRRSPMDGCDGWCLTTGAKTIIRINGNLTAARQRFTLAHELGHLILGIPTVVGESFEDMLRSNSGDERRVNDLASELLIPAAVVKDSLPELPVVAAALKKLAKRANVSELAAAVRVCKLASAIGLVNASVVLFDGAQLRWQWSPTLSVRPDTAVRLLAAARKAAPSAFRRVRESGDVIVASTIENPFFGTATLFVQLLPAEIGMKLSRDERRKALEGQLFADHTKLRQRVSGLMGQHKNRRENKTLAESEADFWNRYREKLKDTPLDTKAGREYVNLRLSEWY
jgi:Zn-dependent peptidase ImmA (M78 family)